MSKGQTNSADLKELNNQYYTKIPHDFGMNRPTIINSNALVDRELKLLEALGEIEIAMKVLKSSGDASVNPIDSHYDSLKCAMNPIEHGKNEWNVIEEYIKNTHAATHANYSLDLEDVFEIGRDGESERFKKDIDNHQLLWHGSRLTNFVGILSQGLRIAPPEAPVTGYVSCALLFNQMKKTILFYFFVDVWQRSVLCRHGLQVRQLLLHQQEQQHWHSSPLRGTIL